MQGISLTLMDFDPLLCHLGKLLNSFLFLEFWKKKMLSRLGLNFVFCSVLFHFKDECENILLGKSSEFILSFISIRKGDS